MIEKLKLRALNAIVVPDWQQPEAAVYQALTDIVRSLTTHVDREHITLLINRGNFSEDAESSLEEVVYNLVLNLLLSEEIDVANTGLEISLVEELSPAELEALHQLQVYRITFAQEDVSAVANSQLQSLPSFELSAFLDKRKD